MYCENCGIKLENDWRYCNSCGNKIATDNDETTNEIQSEQSEKKVHVVERNETTQQMVKMNKTLYFILTMIVGIAFVVIIVHFLDTSPLLKLITGPSTDDIGKNVLISMKSKFNQDPILKTLNAKINNITVTHKNGNEYVGIANIHADGESRNISVIITADGNNVIWKIPSSDMSLLFEKRTRELMFWDWVLR